MKKSTKIILIIIGVIGAIALSILGFYLYVKIQLKNQYDATKKLMEEAKQYATSYEIYDEDIFDKLEKPKGATDGIIYVNVNSEVSMAVIYDDVCYTKLYSSEDFIDFISPNACIQMVMLDAAKNEDIINPDDNVNNEEEPSNDNIIEPDEDFEDRYVNYDQGLEQNQATILYNKYVKYSKFDINAYSNIDVNEDASNEYMVKLAIYNILNDNNVDIKDYEWLSETSASYGYAHSYSKGYKITTEQIENYINKLFDVNKIVNYGELELRFNDNISAYYYMDEGAYRLIADSSIPKSYAAPGDIYSKYISSEIKDDNIIVYSNYFNVVSDTGTSWVEDSVNDDDTYTLCYSTYEGNYICPVGNDETDVEYVINKLSNQVGKFKHTFTKKTDGNYYWVSTEKIN